jgi:hypothetical protein
MLSEMSYGDLKTIGYSLGMTEPDNGSTTATVTNRSSNGKTNNRPSPYVSRTGFIGAARDNITTTASQYENCINTSITQRQRCLYTTANSTSGILV